MQIGQGASEKPTVEKEKVIGRRRGSRIHEQVMDQMKETGEAARQALEEEAAMSRPPAKELGSALMNMARLRVERGRKQVKSPFKSPKRMPGSPDWDVPQVWPMNLGPDSFAPLLVI